MTVDTSAAIYPILLGLIEASAFPWFAQGPSLDFNPLLNRRSRVSSLREDGSVNRYG